MSLRIRRFTSLLFASCMALTFLESSQAAGQTLLNALEQQASLAFNPAGKTFSTLTLSGTTTWVAGSLQDAGTVVLKLSTDGSTSEVWSLGTMRHSVTQTAFSSSRTCSYTDAARGPHELSDANCLRAVPWFAPWSSVLFSSGGLVAKTPSTQVFGTLDTASQLTYITSLDLASSTPSSAQSQLQRYTAFRVSFAPLTSLPSELDYEQALDSDPAHTIQYKTIYSDYRLDAGYMVPHHIQRYVQRTLQADVIITSVTAE